MAEYIDREKLLMGIEALPCDGCTDIDCGECIQELIDDAEPEDAQPVRHGRWKLVGADSRLRGGTWICTACNTCQPYVSDYCPHCGAKMDGGKDDGI